MLSNAQLPHTWPYANSPLPLIDEKTKETFLQDLNSSVNK